MRRSLLLLVIFAATIPSALALPPGEFPLAPLPVGPAPYERRQPMAAANDSAYLIVWEDARVKPNQPRLWAARVNNIGALVDPTGIFITAFAEGSRLGSHLRAVATDGRDFLVVWADDNGRLGAAKVTVEGKVAIAPDPQADAGKSAALVALGSSYGLFIVDNPSTFTGGSTVRLISFDRDGRVIARSTVNGIGNAVTYVAATTNDSHTTVFLGWLTAATNAIHITNIEAANVARGTVTIPSIAFDSSGDSPVELSLATDSNEVLAAWIDEATSVYHARRFTANGFPQGDELSLGPVNETIRVGPEVIWNGFEYVIAYKNPIGMMQVQRVSRDGLAVAPPIAVADPVTEIAAAASGNGNDAILAAAEVAGAGQEITANLLSPSTNALRLPVGLFVSSSFADRSDANVVWRGDHYLGVWRDTLDSARVTVGRFTAEGVPLDGTGLQIGGVVSTTPPVVASDGHTAVVAWSDINGVSSSFVDVAGRVSRLSYDFPGSEPAVNWNGQQYIVAWRSKEGRLLVLRIAANGQLLDVQPQDLGVFPGSPYVGWTGNSYVFVYQVLGQCIPPCTQVGAIFAQMVSPSLTPIGTPIQISDALAAQPSLGDGPNGTLIVWPRVSGGTSTLRAVRVSNGTVLDSLNGLEIGAATQATVYGSPSGWGVVSGPNLWLVSRSGGPPAHFVAFPFVPAGVRSAVVLGGPLPLVVYRREPVGSEQMMQVVAHYAFTPARSRAAKH